MQVTDDYGNSCAYLGSPYINNCNYSTAYHLLQHIYGDIKTATPSMAKQENVSIVVVQSADWCMRCGIMVMKACVFVLSWNHRRCSMISVIFVDKNVCSIYCILPNFRGTQFSQIVKFHIFFRNNSWIKEIWYI